MAVAHKFHETGYVELNLSRREVDLLRNLLGHVVLGEEGPAKVVYGIVKALEDVGLCYDPGTDQWFGRIKESKKNKRRRINKILRKVK